MRDDRTTALQRLIERLRKGDDVARWELVESAHQRLRGLAAKILNEDFERVKQMGLCYTTDLTAEVKLRMAKALEEVELNDVEHFFHLAALRIKWILKDIVKRLPKRAAGKLQSPVPGLPVLYRRPYEELMAKVLDLIEELPNDQQTVVYLKIWLNYTHDEIAKELHGSVKTVQRLWARARATLNRTLRQWLDATEDQSSDYVSV